MSQSTTEHRRESPDQVRCAVITVSDTRTLENDRGGALIVQMLEQAGHVCVERQIIKDQPGPMRSLVERLTSGGEVDAILLTGGTGVGSRDQTYETIATLLTKPLPGYGELFRMLSFEQVGPAAMLSRAVGGVCGRTVVLTMPGSPAGVQLAMEKLIAPELGHLVREARR